MWWNLCILKMKKKFPFEKKAHLLNHFEIMLSFGLNLELVHSFYVSGLDIRPNWNDLMVFSPEKKDFDCWLFKMRSFREINSYSYYTIIDIMTFENYCNWEFSQFVSLFGKQSVWQIEKCDNYFFEISEQLLIRYCIFDAFSLSRPKFHSKKQKCRKQF